MLTDDLARSARLVGSARVANELVEGGPRHLHALVEQAVADALGGHQP